MHSNSSQQGYTQLIGRAWILRSWRCGALPSEDSAQGCVFASLAQPPQRLRWQGLPRSRGRAGSARPSEKRLSFPALGEAR
jgi:hypothetical protein